MCMDLKWGKGVNMNNDIMKHKYDKDFIGDDPDTDNYQLRDDLLFLYKKFLPNGKLFDLQKGNDIKDDYLIWNNWRFASDSITNTYTRHEKYQWMIQDLEKTYFYSSLIKEYREMDYTIGCHILFPKNNNKDLPRTWTINQARGINSKIADRMDLTLECIRRYYNNDKENPLYGKLQENSYFFDLFKDKNGNNGFKGYVDFFYLNDLLLNNDYSSINFFLPFDNFKRNPKPQTTDEWKVFCENQINFVKARNQRISKSINNS